MEVAPPSRGPAVEAVYATGTVEATVMMPIASRNTARLIDLNVDEGSNVTKGQVLARLEDEDLKKTLEELQAKEELARKNHERIASLAQRGYETKSALDQAHSDWDAAVAAVARASAQLDFMKLTAPADGRIIRRDGEIGQIIPANEPVFWMSCCSPLRVSAEVDEEDIAVVAPGQDVLIRADAFPGKVFHGKLQSITPKGDPVSRSYRVRIAFDGETPLQIGMTAETNIIIATRENALLVPNTALLGNKVWLVRDGVLVEQPVTAGAKGTEKTEIREGITPDDEVVLKPSPSLTAGKKVNVKTVPQAP